MNQDTSLSSACDRQHTLGEQLASALAWWREAGVDLDFSDDPASWIAPESEASQPSAAPDKSRAAPPPEPPAPRIAQHRANWPANLADFQSWWLTEPTLGDGDPSRRIAPRGPAGADLMILVAEPEADDSEHLLSGPQGRFLASFLAAAGLSEDRVYFASVLPRNTPLADWDELASAGLADVTRHHVGLAAPKRLITFGGRISSLLGHNPTQSPNFKLDINHGDGEIFALACWDLAALLMRGKARSGFWQRWLDWTVSNA